LGQLTIGLILHLMRGKCFNSVGLYLMRDKTLKQACVINPDV